MASLQITQPGIDSGKRIDWEMPAASNPPLPPSTELLAAIKSQGKPTPWSEQEIRAFQALVIDRIGIYRVRKVDWNVVAMHIGTRTPEAIKSRFRQMLSEMPHDSRASLMQRRLSHNTQLCGSKKAPKARTRVWTPQEDDALKTAVALYGAHKWRMISEFVETRRPSQCYNRWRYMNSPLSGKRGPPSYWINVMYRKKKLSKAGSSDGSSVLSAILNQQLQEAMDRDASSNTGVVLGTDEVSEEIIGAVDRAVLKPFSVDEDKLIIQLVRLHGRKWGHITRLLNTANQQRERTRDLGSDSQTTQKRTANWVCERFRLLSRPIEPVPGCAELRSDSASLATKPVPGDGLGPSKPISPNLSEKRTDDIQSVTPPKHSRWTVAEDEELARIVKKALSHENGFLSWSDVAKQMSTQRSKTQCSTRWLQTVGTHLKHTHFSRLEDEAIWPFVLSRCQGKSSRVVQGAEPQGTVGIGWVSARLRASRSTNALARRIYRLTKAVRWLKAVGGVSDAHLHFDLVHKLANTPSDFRIVAKK